MISTNNNSVSRKRRAITEITLTALFAAIIAAGTFIAIPLYPVPVVLQNLFTLLAGLILGPVLGGAAVALYLLAGALGAPVFAGATGGIARFFGPTGGFLIGYLLSAIVAGCIAGRPRAGVKTPLWRIVLAAVVGNFIVYLPGLPWLGAVMKPEALGSLAVKFMSGNDNLKFIPVFIRSLFGGMNPLWIGTLVAGFFPFIPGAVFKVIAAIIVTPRLRRAAAGLLSPPVIVPADPAPEQNG
jgi:biotin transport system substrate-specific component